MANCVNCGVELNEFNTRPAPKKWTAFTGLTPYCYDCQQRFYDEMADETSPSLAFFYCCIAFNAPFDMKAIPLEGEEKPWIAYMENLRAKKLGTTRGGEPYSFFQGLINISKIFGADLEKGEFSRAVDLERSARGRKEGTIKQRKDWGYGPKKNPYSTDDYNELDRIYEAFSKDFRGQGGLNAKQEYILRDCASMEFAKQEYLRVGNVNMAQKLNAMIQTNLASENLRKKDEKPLDDLRIDSIVDALERKGYMKNGKLLSHDQLLEKLRGDNPRYPYTKDAADQMLLTIINASRSNDGLSEYSVLPKELELEDVNGEFAEEPLPMEKEAYEKLGLLRKPPAKKKGGSGK